MYHKALSPARILGLLLLLVSAVEIPTAHGQSRDPLVGATLGAWTSDHHAGTLSANPGRLAFDDEDRTHRRIALPTGLWDLIFDRPELEPEDGDFDWIDAVDASLRSNTVLSLGGDDSPGLGFGGPGGTATPLAVLRPSQLEEFLPHGASDQGITRVRVGIDKIWPVGGRYGTLRVLFLQYERRSFAQLSPDLRLQDWMDGAPPVDGEVGRLRVDTFTGANFSSGISWAREFRLHTPEADPSDDWRDAWWDQQERALRLGLGATVRRSTGIVFQRYRGDLEFEANGGQLQYRPQMRRELSEADLFDHLPGTWAVDLGAVLRWHRFEFGAGVSDLFADWQWSESTVDFFQTNVTTNEVTRVREETSAKRGEPGPGERWRLDVRYRRGRARVFAAATGGLGGSDLSLGTTVELSERWQGRGGLQRDRRHAWQFGAGIARRGARIGWELGAQTHSYNLSGHRELALSLALVTRR